MRSSIWYIAISNDRLQQLPVDGSVADEVIVVAEEELSNSQEAPPVEGEEEAEVDVEVDDDAPNVETVIGDGEAPRPTSSMVLNLNITETEVEQLYATIQEIRQKRLQNRVDVPEPEIRSTPIDEISRQVRIYAMAFPSIFPRGLADWNEGRQRSVTLAEWGEHLLRYHDGRFGRHPRFRYLLFNQIMRSRARGKSTYYVNKEAELKGMDLDALSEALGKDESLLNQIVRQGKGLSGTRPFWKSYGMKLRSMAVQLQPLSASFITFSAADHQWDDLHRHLPNYEEFSTGTEAVRNRVAFKNVQDNPHVIAAYLNIRFDMFFREVYGRL